MQEQAKVDYLLNKINILVKLGRESQVLREYDEIMKVSGEDPEIRFKKGVLLLKMKKFSEAVNEFEKAITLDNSSSIYHYAKALSLNLLEDYPESLKEINEVLRLVSGNGESKKSPEPSRNVKNEVERLLKHFEELGSESIGKDRRNGSNQSGVDLIEQNRKPSESRSVNKTTTENFLDTDYTDLVEDLKKFDHALRSVDSHFNRLREINKEMIQGIEDKEDRLARILNDTDDPQVMEILNHYSDVLRLDVNGEDARNLRKMGLVIEENPKNAELHYGKALFLFTRGELDEALKEIEISSSLDPVSSAYTFGKTLIQNRIMDYEQTIRVLTKSVKSDPDNPVLHFKRGAMLYMLGRFGEASDEFSNAIDLYQFDPRYYYGRTLAKYQLMRHN